MKIVTIVGARPQFIKAATVSRVIHLYNRSFNNQISEVIIHTGQHFDKNMSDVFFTELGMSMPNYNLEIASMPHGAMTGRMLEKIELVLQKEKPNLVLIYGDTNSTLAGALAAAKMHIPVAHVEAGLRSFNIRMPEEINRIVTDRISNYLFCPTQTSVDNLNNEGIVQNVYNVGDVMYDATLYYREKAKQDIQLTQWGIKDNDYVLCTIHRAENTDNIHRLESIFEALREISLETPVILPIHPRTRKLLKEIGKENWLSGITILDPLPYLEMLRLESTAKVILTDSGGIQKEAFFHQVPCLTLRDETEWVETVSHGWNKIVGYRREKIMKAYNEIGNITGMQDIKPYGSGEASNKIVEIISKIN